MIEVDRVARQSVYLSNGVCIHAPGPVSEAQDFEGLVIVVVKWMSGSRSPGRRTLRWDNVYGYDKTGTRRWRVARPHRNSRPLFYSGFLAGTSKPWLHEVYGWHVELDARTGAILRSESVS